MTNLWIERRKKIFEKMENDSLLILFSGKPLKKSADAQHEFYTNNNFYYLANIDREDVVLLIEKKEGTLKEILFIKKKNNDVEKWFGKYLTIEESQGLSGIKEVLHYEDFEAYIIKKINLYAYQSMYLDLENDNFFNSKSQGQLFADKIIDRYPGIRIRNIFFEISNMRRIKDSYEIERIIEAIRITNDGISHLAKNIKPNQMEYQAESYFDFILKQNGAIPSFETIAAAGSNATTLHYISNSDVIRSEDLILFDLGASKDKYSSDVTRTLPASGKFTERQKSLYSIVLLANKKAIEACKPGITLDELNEMTKEILTQGLLNLNLIKSRDELIRYYYHGVSHHLGLDVHDVGDRTLPLKAGCVITIEPGLYISEENMGIRIEDDILITEDGYINLTRDIPKEIDDVENMMKTS
ncbi:MAG: aminopeptidase P family protein [Tissierellales bacterium]|nr:aminopeptidase P family protein [Tissierellales bacterium]MBN2827517.1 aminopeptidase P family protein [Tissierellales bacterium]